MRRALALARKGEGLTRPNPPVGAVVVRRGRLVGEGYHRKAGGPHAEVLAMRKAGAQAKGATLYVTLEPCSTWGRTPPCTEAILSAGIRRLVVAASDPNPKHAGHGLDLLRKKGLTVTEGVGQAEALRLLAPFSKWITTQRPLVTLKLGMTLDGRLADGKGCSRWITGPVSRKQVHLLRQRVDGVLIGRGTAAADNPSLLPVPSHGRRPYRIVLDSRGRISLRSRLFTDGQPRQTIVATSAKSPLRYRQRLQAKGVEVLVLPAGPGGLRLDSLMAELGRLGLMHVLCEGGGRLAGALLQQDLVDEGWFFIAPRLLGDQGVPALGGVSWSLAQAPSLTFTAVEQMGDDVLIKAVRKES